LVVICVSVMLTLLRSFQFKNRKEKTRLRKDLNNIHEPDIFLETI